MLIKVLVGLAISTAGLLALILFMSGNSPNRPGSAQTGSPTPIAVQATPEPLSKEEALSATQIAKKAQYAPSAMELATAAAAEERMRKVMTLTLPPVTDRSYPINSVGDLPQVVYNYPLSENRPYMPCLRAKEPGAPLFLKSISRSPDYYMIPFFKNSQLCALAIVNWQDGLGRLYSIMPSERFLFVEASEAMIRVEQASGKKVTGTPVLVQGKFQESYDPARPFWQVTTADGQIYYVLTRSGGQIEANTFVETVTTVIKAEDMHPLD